MIQTRQVPLGTLVEYAGNAKIHDEANIEAIRASIRRFGNCDPIGVWTNEHGELEIVEGHGRKLALEAEGYEYADVIMLDHLTDEERRAYTLAHNQTTLMTDFDLDALEIELEALADFGMEDFGFDVSGVGEGTAGEPAEVVEDELPESAPKRCNAGDVWKLGKHRLMCGDATDANSVESLMGGEKALLVFTDPPYNVDYASKNEFLNQVDNGRRIEKDIEGDAHESDEEVAENLWTPAFKNMRDNADDYCSIYVTMPQGGAHMMMMMMMSIQSASWQVKHELIWAKNNHVLGRADYFYKHEPILYGWAKKHRFYGGGEFDKSVWEIEKPAKSDLHPTMKPIRLIANCILNSSKEGDAVLDVFGGSGSTLIACEQTGRTCYTMELDPHYCDVIIERWEQFTGQEAVKVSAAQP